MPPIFLKHKKSILFSILFIIVLTAIQKFGQWDIADEVLSRYTDTVAILYSASSKYSSDGKTSNTQRTQTYVLIPTSLDIPTTVSVHSDNGAVTVEEDKYGVLKLLILFIIVAPILAKLAKKFGVGRVEIKG